MNSVAYASPWVPPEWIAAHGLRPQWTRPRPAKRSAGLGAGRGVCPFAAALVESLSAGKLDLSPFSAAVLTTTCDQMRYAAALVEQTSPLPVFLMNVPSTWQTAAARQLYRDELERLGRFLAGLGGAFPAADESRQVMLDYEAARSALGRARPRLSARQFAEALANLRSGGTSADDGPEKGTGPICAKHPEGGHRPKAGPGKLDLSPFPPARCARAEEDRRVPLALLGGPLVAEDYPLLDAVEQAGGRIVLDATESGERTLPGPLDPSRLRDDPLDALVEAYFVHIADAFRRPNHGLYEWLARQVAERGVRGVLLRRYLWCDLWHAELHPLRQRSAVPVLELDAVDDDPGSLERTIGRIEAFLEMLR